MGKNPVKKAIFIQARLSSTRLPSKLFFELQGKSILKHIIDRVNLIKNSVDYIVLVVPENEEQLIREHIKDYADVIIFGGDKENVLKRFYDANQKIQADVIIRLTGDNPLVDIFHLKKALIKHIKFNSDYTVYQKLPLGTGFEILSSRALNEAAKNATTDYQLEHVTPYIRENRDKFNIFELKTYKFYQHPEYRLTIDEENDYKLMQIIYNNLYNGKPIHLRKVLKFLQENPKILNINREVKQVKVP